MELNKQLSLPAILRAETSAAKHEHHGMLSLQLRELAVLPGVVGKVVVRKRNPWNNVTSHVKSS
jgi:hypothetical protein